jgi:acyl-CoA synthetase (AMP-forming)/AMP-acid ligase II
LEEIGMIWPPKESNLYINPKLPESRREALNVAMSAVTRRLRSMGEAEPYIGVATSGSSSDFERLVVHSVRAFEISAMAVNRRLGATAGDRWLQTLPEFHVGGLAMLARAFVAKGEYISSELGQVGGWSVEKFVFEMNRVMPQFISIVPAQAYDLAQAKINPVKGIKALLVGAGHLPTEVADFLKKQGWPLYTSYAMTECASTIAIGDGSGEFKALDHVRLTVASDEGKLEIESEALYLAKTTSTDFCGVLENPPENSGEALPETAGENSPEKSSNNWSGISSKSGSESLTDNLPNKCSSAEILFDILPKKYISSDIVKVHARELASSNKIQVPASASHPEYLNSTVDIFSVLGRTEDFCKILGESVNLVQLRRQWLSLVRSKPTFAAKFEMPPNARALAKSQLLPNSEASHKMSYQEFKSEILAAFDMRRGAQLILIYEEEDTQADSQNAKMISHLVGRFNAAVAPFERIQNVRAIGKNKIPYSPLGKLLSVQALALIGEKPLSNIIRN